MATEPANSNNKGMYNRIDGGWDHPVQKYMTHYTPILAYKHTMVLDNEQSMYVLYQMLVRSETGRSAAFIITS